jgi:hypothetical protein
MFAAAANAVAIVVVAANAAAVDKMNTLCVLQ